MADKYTSIAQSIRLQYLHEYSSRILLKVVERCYRLHSLAVITLRCGLELIAFLKQSMNKPSKALSISGTCITQPVTHIHVSGFSLLLSLACSTIHICLCQVFPNYRE